MLIPGLIKSEHRKNDQKNAGYRGGDIVKPPNGLHIKFGPKPKDRIKDNPPPQKEGLPFDFLPLAKQPNKKDKLEIRIEMNYPEVITGNDKIAHKISNER